jgi:chemotaxis protein CheC
VTGSPEIGLTDLENDALSELVNIGVGRAAASLRNMIGEQVVLSVPAVSLLSRQRAAEVIGEREAGSLVAVHQVFEGDFSGRALLIFPEVNSLELVRAVTGGDLPLPDIIELEQEALAETGNIVLNSCLATIANVLRRKMRMSLPEILRGTGNDLFDAPQASDAENVVLFLYIDFTVRSRGIRGYIALLMDLPELNALKVLLGEFISRSATDGTLPSHVAS